MAMKKIIVRGFIITCLKCGQHNSTIEVRQDGVDLQCKVCGNKLLLRPGEFFVMQGPPGQNQPPATTEAVEQTEQQSPTEQIVASNIPEEIQQKIQEQAELLEQELSQVPKDDWPAKVLDEYVQKLGGAENFKPEKTDVDKKIDEHLQTEEKNGPPKDEIPPEPPKPPKPPKDPPAGPRPLKGWKNPKPPKE
jgi:DNA-directed RNA polymerase subunit RPC12/RpoP